LAQDKTLIAYSTKGGATKEAAELIMDILSEEYGLMVDLVNLNSSMPSLEDYNFIIIGAGVRMARVYKKALKFMDKDFSGRPVAVFLSSSEGGDEHTYEEAVEKYLEKEVKPRLNVTPVDMELFGGKFEIFGFSLQNNIDKEKIKNWGRKIGKKICPE